MHSFRWLVTVGLVAGLGLSCTKKDKADYNLSLSETLRINLTTEPPTLDWIKSTDTTSAQVQENIMEGLVQFDYEDPELKLLPALATEWSPSEKGRVWTFTLRQGVKWTDGQDFTGQQIVDGWERLLNPKTAAEYAYFLYGVKNARKYNEGKLTDFSQVGVKATADGKFVVELEEPMAYFPNLLTHHSTFPIRKDVIEKAGDRWTEPENIQTLGPFRLKIWEHDKALVLERNESYYGEKPALKNVVGYMITEMSTAQNLFDSGKMDVLTQLPATELRALKKRPEYKEKGVLTIYYYGFNVKKKPLDNPKVRKAISHAIDRSEITQLLAAGFIPLTSWVPPGMFGYEAERGINFDVAKAQKLLDEAGYKDRSQFPKLVLAFNTNENHQRIAENVQAQLKRNLGIDVEIKNEEWKVYLNTLKSDPPHIYRLGWQADYPDPDNFMTLMTSYSENNHTHWVNKEFDQVVEKAAVQLSREDRKKLYSKAQAILTEVDVPVVPIYAGVNHLLIANRVKNFPVNSLGRFPLKKVQLQ